MAGHREVVEGCGRILMRHRHSDTPQAFLLEGKDGGIFKRKKCKMVVERRERYLWEATTRSLDYADFKK
jgi:hypothetical protein